MAPVFAFDHYLFVEKNTKGTRWHHNQNLKCSDIDNNHKAANNSPPRHTTTRQARCSTTNARRRAADRTFTTAQAPPLRRYRQTMHRQSLPSRTHTSRWRTTPPSKSRSSITHECYHCWTTDGVRDQQLNSCRLGLQKIKTRHVSVQADHCSSATAESVSVMSHHQIVVGSIPRRMEMTPPMGQLPRH